MTNNLFQPMPASSLCSSVARSGREDSGWIYFSLMNRSALMAPLVFCLPSYGQAVQCSALEPVNTPRPEYPSPEQAKMYLPGTHYIHIFVKGEVTVQYDVRLPEQWQISSSPAQPIVRQDLPMGGRSTGSWKLTCFLL